jgi:pimeloyl-ACP methyl ester carboxylesterase
MEFLMFWDQHSVRFQLLRSNTYNRGVAYNWLFVPGGPGADCLYLRDLAELLQLPGNVWLLDFPGNGSNSEGFENYAYDGWYELFIPTISQFQNPIYVGHSFGGMLPLLYPQLENILKGLVLVSATPSLWFEASARMAEQRQLPLITGAMEVFVNDPTPETFKTALLACLPYYFPKQSLARGKAALENIPFNYHAACWGQQSLVARQYNAKWIPQTVPTLILGGSEDCITPFLLFENDPRFIRDNILMHKIMHAGHMPWIESPSEVKKLFQEFMRRFPENVIHQQ